MARGKADLDTGWLRADPRRMDDIPSSPACHASFSLHGFYRVQSQTDQTASTLAGRWINTAALGCLDAIQATRLALAHPAFVERDMEVTLEPALVSVCTGAFAANDDALYYADHFLAADGASHLQKDILDVRKLQRLWTQRRKVLEPWVHPCSRGMSLFDADIVPIAIDEYMCHEAGHLLGIAVRSKQHQGYFRLGGKFRWPLVYLEEFRADINAWDLAIANLDAARARNVVEYTLLHRLGLAAGNLCHALPGAGFVPFLDFTVAWRAGVLQVMKDTASPIRFDLTAPALDRLRHEIRTIADRLNVLDLQPSGLWETARRSMSYLDEALHDEDAVSAFRASLLPAERVTGKRVAP